MNTWESLGPTEDLPPIVYPVGDLRDHNLDGEECWCKPFWDGHILVHNSMDRREEYERAERKPS